VCLTCVGGHSFSHRMNTHEPFMRFDGLLDSFSCGLGHVREHAGGSHTHLEPRQLDHVFPIVDIPLGQMIKYKGL
jgi:hypothetical protein